MADETKPRPCTECKHARKCEPERDGAIYCRQFAETIRLDPDTQAARCHSFTERTDV